MVVVAPWHIGNIEVTDEVANYLQDNWHGFVYEMTYTDKEKQGKQFKYVGQKGFWSNHIQPKRKNDTRRRRKKKVTDWKDYMSSSWNLLNEQFQSPLLIRNIVHLAPNKGTLNYLELYEQISKRVLTSEEYVNGIIQVKIARQHCASDCVKVSKASVRKVINKFS